MPIGQFGWPGRPASNPRARTGDARSKGGHHRDVQQGAARSLAGTRGGRWGRCCRTERRRGSRHSATTQMAPAGRDAALPVACLGRDHAAHAALHCRGYADLRRQRVPRCARCRASCGSIRSPMPSWQISLALVPIDRVFRAPSRGWRRRRRSGSCSGCCWSMWRTGGEHIPQRRRCATVLGLPCLALIPACRRALKGATSRTMSRSGRIRRWRNSFAHCVPACRCDRPAAHRRGDGGAPEEGKTTIPGAARLAAMNGERVIVLDCDIRHPSVRSTPGIQGWSTTCGSGPRWPK